MTKTIRCPEETGKAPSCGACTLCWTAPDVQIAFADRGRAIPGRTGTIHPSTIRDPGKPNRDGLVVLRSCRDNEKIGGWVERGDLAAAPIFGLTLEERATCPACHHWATCYGNNMPFAHRFRHGPALLAGLRQDLSLLSARYRRYLVRLHILGDFYSAAYVRFWSAMLKLHRSMTVYGYTARVDTSDPIHRELVAVARRYRARWRVRWSTAGDGITIAIA